MEDLNEQGCQIHISEWIYGSVVRRKKVNEEENKMRKTTIVGIMMILMLVMGLNCFCFAESGG